MPTLSSHDLQTELIASVRFTLRALEGTKKPHSTPRALSMEPRMAPRTPPADRMGLASHPPISPVLSQSQFLFSHRLAPSLS